MASFFLPVPDDVADLSNALILSSRSTSVFILVMVVALPVVVLQAVRRCCRQILSAQRCWKVSVYRDGPGGLLQFWGLCTVLT
ncbi:unnamed protein product [Ixodes pacificus]